MVPKYASSRLVLRTASASHATIACPFECGVCTHRCMCATLYAPCFAVELAANRLSPTPKPMVLVKSVGGIEAYPPSGPMGRDFFNYALVGKGAFTVDSDRLVLGKHLLDIIGARKALALADGDLIQYRTLHAATAHLVQGTGVEVAHESFDDWMESMRFVSVSDEATTSGATPLHYAALSHRVDLVQALLARGASPTVGFCRTDPQRDMIKDAPPFSWACLVSASSAMISTLLPEGTDLRAKLGGKRRMHAYLLSFMSGGSEAINVVLDREPEVVNDCDPMGMPSWA
jgi:hypothetical protein